jgi:hypothetical protein
LHRNDIKARRGSDEFDDPTGLASLIRLGTAVWLPFVPP